MSLWISAHCDTYVHTFHGYISVSQRQQDVEKAINTQNIHIVLILDLLHGLNYKNEAFPKLALFLSLPEDGSRAGFLNMAFFRI